MQPFDPVRPEEFFTLNRQRELAKNDAGMTFAILDGVDLAGTIALSNIARGPFQSANAATG